MVMKTKKHWQTKRKRIKKPLPCILQDQEEKQKKKEL